MDTNADVTMTVLVVTAVQKYLTTRYSQFYILETLLLLSTTSKQHVYVLLTKISTHMHWLMCVYSGFLKGYLSF